MSEPPAETKARCFKCGGPMPKGWYFVKWCDPCLKAHNAEHGVVLPGTETKDQESADA